MAHITPPALTSSVSGATAPGTSTPLTQAWRDKAGWGRPLVAASHGGLSWRPLVAASRGGGGNGHTQARPNTLGHACWARPAVLPPVHTERGALGVY